MKKQKDQQVNKEDFDRLQTEFDGLKELATQLETQLKRAIADYQNLEKRVAEGRSELTNWATTELIRKLLTVLDHLEKVVDLGRPYLSEHREAKEWYKGVELAVKQFQQVLKDEGLEEIPADGVFDPALHEAVDTREGEHDKILEVVEKGYNLNGKILKPVRVIVGKKE